MGVLSNSNYKSFQSLVARELEEMARLVFIQFLCVHIDLGHGTNHPALLFAVCVRVQIACMLGFLLSKTQQALS